MSKIQFLDPTQTVSGSERTKIESAETLIWSGDYSAATTILEPIAAGSGMGSGFASLLLGDIYHFQWDHPESLNAYASALGGFRKNGQPAGEILTTYRRVDTHLDAMLTSGAPPSDYTEARGEFLAAWQTAQAMNHSFLIAFGHHYEGLFKIAEGDLSGALSELDSAEAIRDSIGDSNHYLSSRSLRAVVELQSGNYEQARTIANETYMAQIGANLQGAAQRTLLTYQLAVAKAFGQDSVALRSGFTFAGGEGTSPFQDTALTLTGELDGPEVSEGMLLSVATLHS